MHAPLSLLPRAYSTLLIDDNEDTYEMNTKRGFAVWDIEAFLADEHYMLCDEARNAKVVSQLADAEAYIKAKLDSKNRFDKKPRLAHLPDDVSLTSDDD